MPGKTTTDNAKPKSTTDKTTTENAKPKSVEGGQPQDPGPQPRPLPGGGFVGDIKYNSPKLTPEERRESRVHSPFSLRR
jgi:hypothetical protein